MSIAAIIIRRERRVVERFREAGAVGPETARPLSDLRVDEERALSRLKRRAVIREAPAGGYYLDERSWSARWKFRRMLVAFVLLVGAAIVAVASFAVGGG